MVALIIFNEGKGASLAVLLLVWLLLVRLRVATLDHPARVETLEGARLARDGRALRPRTAYTCKISSEPPAASLQMKTPSRGTSADQEPRTSRTNLRTSGSPGSMKWPPPTRIVREFGIAVAIRWVTRRNAGGDPSPATSSVGTSIRARSAAVPRPLCGEGPAATAQGGCPCVISPQQ